MQKYFGSRSNCSLLSKALCNCWPLFCNWVRSLKERLLLLSLVLRLSGMRTVLLGVFAERKAAAVLTCSLAQGLCAGLAHWTRVCPCSAALTHFSDKGVYAERMSWLGSLCGSYALQHAQNKRRILNSLKLANEIVYQVHFSLKQSFKQMFCSLVGSFAPVCHALFPSLSLLTLPPFLN